MNILGKSVSIAIVAILVSAGLVSAALLTYYGRIRATVEVQQSILVDGQDYLTITPDNIPEPAPGGENFYFKHTLTNQASIPVTVDFETTYSPDGDGITTTYFELLGYENQYVIPIDGSPNDPLVLTVEDGECSVTWTFDFPVENFTGNGNLNVGLIIALNGDGNGPAFQIHNNDGATGNYPHGAWLYGSWGPTTNDGWFGWPDHDTDIPVENFDWVSATGARKADNNPTGILTITISKAKLGATFHWAASPTVGSGFYAPVYDDTMQTPSAFGWSTPIVNMATPNYHLAQVMGAVTSMTIQSGTTVDFYICYSFDVAIKPKTYTITTAVVPA